ncbi:MAG: hypothetical protein ACRDTF_05780 [Pseudonocardiaceae bacterium]
MSPFAITPTPPAEAVFVDRDEHRLRRCRMAPQAGKRPPRVPRPWIALAWQGG